ncbi:MFS transporter [Dactylosporangium matsuzakiense]|uniref:MFS transporter n=1 Tax=Dactylosporangium matsuzakiense TaxID=53360 RepID=A0A9W6KNU1_9ACTN|nr:MFS transporter [Dactylosporangium matsuzakiense]GLL03741.1 MFS transporter [Dactylosporangium matsuzakiense]
MAWSRLLIDITPLRNAPAFRRLWIGSALSSFGSQMTSFTVALQVYTLTHSSLAVGGVGIAVAVPAVLFGLVGGAIADSMDRRRLALVACAMQTAVSAMLALQAIGGFGSLWLLYLLVAAGSTISAVSGPVRRTFLPRLLEPGQVAPGAALNMLAMHASLTAGPLAAGAVVAIWGVKAAYLMDLITFLGAFYGLFRLPPMPPEGAIKRPSLHAIREGLTFIRRSRVVAGAFLADINATLLGMPFALFPAINAAHFGGRSQTLGLLTAAPAIGGVIGSMLSGPVGRVTRPGRAILVAGAVWGASLACFGLTTYLWLAVAMLIVAGAADVVSVIMRTAVVQLATPDNYRGRVSAAEFVVGTGVPQLGNFRAGAVASLLSPVASAVIGGSTVIAGAAAVALAIPEFRRTTSPAAPSPELTEGASPATPAS